jgi:hypothetical protein
MPLAQNRWFRRLGFGAIAAVALSVTAMTAAPAQAQEYGYRGPMIAYHASYFPRFFYGFGGGHPWDHRDHWDHADRWDHGDRWDHHWR